MFGHTRIISGFVLKNNASDTLRNFHSFSRRLNHATEGIFERPCAREDHFHVPLIPLKEHLP